MKKIILLTLGIILLSTLVLAISNHEVRVIITKNVHFKERIDKNFGLNNEEGITIKNRFSSFEGVSASVTREEFEKLKNDKRYTIREARKYYISLDTSIPQIKANFTWNLEYNSTNITGSGQSVCIIDTGVNYNHSAFGNCYGNNNASSNCTIIGGWDYVNNDADPIDDQGHGTHVAGIVASQDSTYKGVSPGAKIIMIKAMDNLGSGYDTDIISGIDWCVNNATLFNITVISMSLSDCTNHTTYCDNDPIYSEWSRAINAANLKNITVVAAAGNGPPNCGNPPSLSSIQGPGSPACIENATAIGGVDVSDNFYNDGQRGGSILELMAPGVAIRSTVIGGGFGLKTGTSMSTPHVAGIIALLQQFAQAQNGTLKTPDQLEYLLNTTGKIINDTTGTKLNFTRVDAYQSILTMDLTAPETNLSSPIDGFINAGLNQNFTCNTTDWQLANTTLYVWNDSGGLYNSSMSSMSGTRNTTTITYLNMTATTYHWNCETYDSRGNRAYAQTNNTVTTGGIYVELISPANNTLTNVALTNYTCNATSDTSGVITNITLKIWNSSGVLVHNTTRDYSGRENTSLQNYTFTTSGDYTWNCLGMNNNTNTSLAARNYSLSYDATPPIISNINSSVTSSSASITWTTDELSNASITGELSASSNSFVLSHSLTTSGLSSSRKYTYYITSCDTYNNCATTPTQEVTTSSSSSSGGGSGGGNSLENNGQYVIKKDELDKGAQRIMKRGEALVFNISAHLHTLTLMAIDNATTNISIESEIFYSTIKTGEEQKFNLSNESYYDVYIKLISVGPKAAVILIKGIHEAIPKTNTTTTVKEDSLEDTIGITEDENNKQPTPWLNWKLLVFVILAIFIIIYALEKLFFTKKLKGSKTSKKKKKHHTRTL